MPKTFKSMTVLMLPTSNADNTLLPSIGEIAIGNLLAPNSNGSNVVFAILKSRTMAESIINEMNLIDVYLND